MDASNEFDEHVAALRAEVCSHCIERAPGSPPCGISGKGCGIEEHVPKLAAICRSTDSALMDPYIEKLHEEICAQCKYRDTPSCPCPLNYLLQLAVEAVEKVERRRAARLNARESDSELTNSAN